MTMHFAVDDDTTPAPDYPPAVVATLEAAGYRVTHIPNAAVPPGPPDDWERKVLVSEVYRRGAELQHARARATDHDDLVRAIAGMVESEGHAGLAATIRTCFRSRE